MFTTTQGIVLGVVCSVVGLGVLLVIMWRLAAWWARRRRAPPSQEVQREAQREEVYRVPSPVIIEDRRQRVIVLDMGTSPEVFQRQLQDVLEDSSNEDINVQRQQLVIWGLPFLQQLVREGVEQV